MQNVLLGKAIRFGLRHPDERGRGLPDSERSFFKLRFGRDFSHGRMHADVQAAEAAHSVTALAYIKVVDVVFDEGQWGQEQRVEEDCSSTDSSRHTLGAIPASVAVKSEACHLNFKAVRIC